MEILAKPNGVTLDAHVRHLFDQCHDLLDVRDAAIKKYNRLTGGQYLPALLELAIRWHDEGKKDRRWQKPCQLDYEDYLRSPEKKVEGKHLRAAHIRHEMASLLMADQQKVNLPVIVKAAIAAHHGKLGERHEKRWRDEAPEFAIYWDAFKRLSYNPPGGSEYIAQRYAFAGPRALLQLADHRASASEGRGEDDALIPFRKFEYTFPYRNPDGSENRRGVQQIIDELQDERFAILRAPTGSGKTDAALLWARHQITQGRADCLIIAMPTRFTASALSGGITENLGKTGISHGAGVYHSSTFLKQGRDEQEMARLLETPISVTTIDHLCICLTGAREDHHAIFFNLANSCVVIDEADFYDDFTQQNIVVLLKALYRLDVPVLVMSATVPESATRLYSQSGFNVSRIYEDKSTTGIENATRARCDLHLPGESERPEDIAHLLQRSLDGEALIIYANTVKRAQAYYNWFANKGVSKDRLVLYHSRFTETHKAAKEQCLLELLGPDAWAAKKPPTAIAILTQIGEMSVNISARVMISDVCPADRLAQRVGRLCRFPDASGQYAICDLYVVTPMKRDKTDELSFYPAPYGEWHKNIGWVERATLTETRKLLQEKTYSASDFVNLVNKIYPDLAPLSGRTKINRNMLEALIRDYWLILPRGEIEVDADRTDFWMSRDISPQATVYVDAGFDPITGGRSQMFKNWMEFRRFEMECGVQCSLKDAQNAQKNGFAEEIHVQIASYSRDESTDKAIRVVRPEYYTEARGLWFDIEDNE